MSRQLTGPLTDEQIAELKTRLPLNDVEYIKAERESLASSSDDEEKKTTSAKK